MISQGFSLRYILILFSHLLQRKKFFDWWKFSVLGHIYGRSQWPRGLRRRSSAPRLLRSWVRIPRGAWMFDCCDCCMLSGRGLCDGLITRPEESYWLWRVVECDQETSKTRVLKPATGLWKIQPQWAVTPGKQANCGTNSFVQYLISHIFTIFSHFNYAK